MANSAVDLTSFCGIATVLLSTPIVIINSPFGATTKTRALIDPGAEVSFISESLVQRLKLGRSSVSIPIIGVGNCKMMTKGSTIIIVSSRINKIYSNTIETYILQKLTSYTPKCVKSKESWPHLNNLPLTDPNFASNTLIELIIGVHLFSLIIQEKIVRGPAGAPLGRKTSLGWILVCSSSTIHSSCPLTVQIA